MSGFAFSFHYVETDVFMKQYNDFIDDPYFMKWVFQSDDSTERYWRKYMENNPDEKKLILSVREELCRLQMKNKDLTKRDKDLLLQKIQENKHPQTFVIRFRQYTTRMFPYAAILFLALLLGNIVMYFYLNRQFSQSKINYAALEYIYPTDAPKLILSDGTDVSLERSSVVKYHSREKEVVVDNQSVKIPSNNSIEPIPNQLIIPSGSRSKITLSDSTVVYLNAGSKLIYPSAFDKNTREVVLFGEAYFEVTKNRHKPFVVKTTAVDIEVLGTHFNVSAYSDDDQIQTVLVEGKVSIAKNDASVFSRRILLNPSQMAVFNKQTKKMIVNNVDVEHYTLWKDGMLKFEDEDLELIMKKIERYYNLKITFSSPSKGRMKISGKLNLSDKPEDVFNYLSVLTKMKIEKLTNKNYQMK